MSTEIPAASQVSGRSAKFRKDLDREAVGLALKGEWERAVEVNRAILELFADDVETMNRLAKALIELGSYEEAREVLGRVRSVAPYNNIARKNLARLEQMSSPDLKGGRSAATRHARPDIKRRAGGAPQLFIGESGKSATTVLRHTPRNLSLASISPGDPVSLVVEHHGISVYSEDGDYLGLVEQRLGHRLARLIEGGNTYESAVIGVHDDGISIIIHETFRHRSLQNVASFPKRAAPAPPPKRERDEDTSDLSAELVEGADDDDEDEEEVIDEEELQAAWSESE